MAYLYVCKIRSHLLTNKNTTSVDCITKKNYVKTAEPFIWSWIQVGCMLDMNDKSLIFITASDLI